MKQKGLMSELRIKVKNSMMILDFSIEKMNERS